MTEQVVVIFLTIAAIFFNLGSAIRAVSMALVLESGSRWVCQTISLNRVIKLLLGFAIICMMLTILKAWSLSDIIIYHWNDQSQAYHIKSFAYLGENFGIAVLCWMFVTYVKQQSNCNTAEDHGLLKEKYKRLVNKYENSLGDSDRLC